MRSYRQKARSLASTLLTSLFLWSVAAAEVTDWRMNDGGENWRSRARSSTAIDDSNPNAIQIAGFLPTDNITQSLVWISATKSESFVEELPTAQIWNNYPLKETDIPMVDGDPNTSTEDRFKRDENQVGRRFNMDLGSRFPISRIVFYPRLTGAASNGIPYSEDYIRGYEIFVNNGLEFLNNRPIYQLINRVEFTRDSLAVVEFPNQFIRYIELRVLSKNAFELAEIELYGTGFVPRAEYTSSVINLGAPTNFGTLSWDAVKLRVDEASGELVETPDADARVSFQMRSGVDDTPEIYYEITNRFLNELTVVNEDTYNGLPDPDKGGMEDDQVNWSTWSAPFTVSGNVVDLPSPRQFIQFRATLKSGTITDGIRIDDLVLQRASPPLARRLFGEISALDDPTPQDGFAIVPVGVPSTFAYDLLVDVRGTDQGFDALEISTPTKPTFIELQMGSDEDNLAPVTPGVIEEQEDGLTLRFPGNRISRPTSLRVLFDAQLLIQSTFFNATVFDTQTDELPQPVLAPPRPVNPIDDPNTRVSTNKLQVLTTANSGQDILNVAEGQNQVITPNGDGANDQIAIPYSILQLLQAVPNTVEIFDLAGRRIYSFSEERGRGEYTATWDGRNGDGEVVPVGLYVFRLTVEGSAEDFVHTSTVGVAY